MPHVGELQGPYAYLGVGHRVRIMDLNDLAAPRLVGETGLLPGLVRLLALADRYAFVVAGQAFAAVDVSDPAAPRPLSGGIRLPEEVHGLAVGAKRACLLGDGALLVYGLEDPAQPRLLATLPVTQGMYVALQDGYAYLAAGENGLRIYALDGPGGPREVGAWAGGAGSVAVRGTCAVVDSGEAGLRVLDVRDPSRPEEVAALPPEAGPYGPIGSTVLASGSEVFLSTGFCDEDVCHEWLERLDLSDPRRPRLLQPLNVPAPPGALLLEGERALFLTTVGGPGEGLACIDLAGHTEGEVRLIQAWSTAGLRVEGEQARLLEGRTVRTFDLSDPSQPRLLGVTALLSESWGADVQGHLAAATLGKPETSVSFLELPDPTHAHELGRFEVGWRVTDVVLASGYAYLAGGPSLLVVDVQDPRQPRQAGFLNVGYPTESVLVAAGRAYITGGTNGDHPPGLLWLADVSDPTDPRLLARLQLPADVADLAVAGRYLYAVTRVYSPAGHSGTFHAIDLQDPELPRLAASLPLPALPGRLVLAGEQAFVYMGDRLYRVDLADPARPRLAGAFAAEWTLTGMQVKDGYLLASGPGGCLYAYRLPASGQ